MSSSYACVREHRCSTSTLQTKTERKPHCSRWQSRKTNLAISRFDCIQYSVLQLASKANKKAKLKCDIGQTHALTRSFRQIPFYYARFDLAVCPASLFLHSVWTRLSKGSCKLETHSPVAPIRESIILSTELAPCPVDKLVERSSLGRV